MKSSLALLCVWLIGAADLVAGCKSPALPGGQDGGTAALPRPHAGLGAACGSPGDPPCSIDAPTCVQGQCLPCAPDAVSCLGAPTFSMVYRCSADGLSLRTYSSCFRDDATSKVCDPIAGQCVSACTAGVKGGCADRASYWVCGASGSYTERASCASGEVCVAEGLCVPDLATRLDEGKAGATFETIKVARLRAAAPETARLLVQWGDSFPTDVGDDYYGVVARTWSVGGTLGAPVLVSAPTQGIQRFADLIGWAEGPGEPWTRSVWENDSGGFGGDPGQGEIWSRSLGGSALTPPLAAAERLTATGNYPAAAALDADTTVVVWGEGHYPSPAGGRILARFEQAGVATSPALPLTILELSEAGVPAARVAALTSDSALVVVERSSGVLEAQCASASGKTLRDLPLAIASITPGRQVILGPIAGSPASGTALVTWYDSSARQFFGRSVGADCEWSNPAFGLTFEGPILVGQLLAVAAWPDGRFAIAYNVDDRSESTDDLYDAGLFIEVRDGAGALAAGPFRIGEPGADTPSAALVAWAPRNVGIVWTQGAQLLGRALDLSQPGR